MPKEDKTTIYKTILKPVLVYGAECWSLTRRTASRVQVAEMKVLRTLRGVTRLDRLRKEQVRTELSIKSILTDIEESKLRLYGHVKTIENTRLARRYLEWRPQAKRPVGRPRKRWIDGMQ